MHLRVVSLAVLAVVASACSGSTEPGPSYGLRIVNAGTDSVFLFAQAMTPPAAWIPAIPDSVPQVYTDSATFVERSLAIPDIQPMITPGASIVLPLSGIFYEDGRSSVAVTAYRIKNGYWYFGNTFYITRAEMRDSTTRLVVKPGRYFPTLVR